MPEYIEREEVKNALLGWDYDPSDDDIECAINHIPTADVVEVVRCKECTEWDEIEGECSHWYGMRENCFCSYGKRKEGAEKC